MPNTPILQLPYPVDGDTASVPRDVKALADAIDPLGVVPVGALMLWPTIVAPAAWLLCDGHQVLAADFPKLAAVLGSAAGQITLPDLRNRFPIGAGVAPPLATGGAATVALAVAEMPAHAHGGATAFRDRSQSHAHPISAVSQPGQSGAPGATYVVGGGVVSTTEAVDAPDHKHAIGAEGGGQAHENRPPFLVVSFIIRAL